MMLYTPKQGIPQHSIGLCYSFGIYRIGRALIGVSALISISKLYH